MLFALNDFSAFVCVLAPVETGGLLFGSVYFIVTCVTYALVLVTPNLHTSAAMRAFKIFWFRAKKLSYARACC